MRVRRLGDRTGANNPNWKGGVRRLGNYVYHYSAKSHPRAVKFGETNYIPRSIINVEKKLGRRVRRTELVHHDDGIKINDSPANLIVMKKGEHRTHHSSGKSNEERARIKKINDEKTERFNENM